MDFLLQQSVNGLALGSVLALYSLGFSLVLANLKVFHLAHAAVFTWGAVAAWQMVNVWQWPTPLGFAVAIVLAGLLNTLAYFVVIRHLQRRKNLQLAAFISSLGGLIVLTELALLFLDHTTVRLPPDTVPGFFWDVAGIRIASIHLVMMATALVLFLILRWMMDTTELGREVKAAAFDREVAEMLGVNTELISAVVFFISGCLAAVGAILVSLAFNVINAEMGSAYLVIAFAVLVIGGFGSVRGAYVAGLIVGLASAYTTAYLTSSYREAVIFLFLLLFLVFRPTGLFNVADTSGRA